MLKLTPEGRQEWRNGWPSVCAGTVGAAASQIHFASLGVFIKPISQSMGWPSSTITLGIFICAVVAVPGSPFAGWLAHRFGLNRVLLIGIPLFCAAFALLGLMSHSRTQWIGAWIIVALAGVPVKANVWMLWVAQKFDAARGIAFGLTASGAGVLAIFVPILTQLCMERVGWRATFPILAGVMAILALSACVAGFRACPPLSEAHALQRGAAGERPKGVSVREALRLRSFWQIAAIGFLIGTGIVSLQVHLVPMLSDKGLDARTAAITAGLFGGAALAGRFVTGVLLDRYSAKVIGMISLLLPALACVIYVALPIDRAAGAAIAILSGVGVGAEGDVLGYITAKFFGVRRFGTIFGIATGIFALGAGVGPLLISLLFDRLGSYVLVVPIIGVTLLISVVLFMTLGPYPILGEGDADSDKAADFRRESPAALQTPAGV